MMKKLLTISVILIMVFMLLPGCSDKESQSATTTVSGGQQQAQASSSGGAEASQSKGAESKKIKPDQLISKDDASKLLGEAVKAGTEDEYEQLGLVSIYYAPENTESKNYLQITVLQKKEEKGGQSGSSGGAESSSKPSASGSQSQSSGSGGQGSEMSPKSLYEGLKKIYSDANAAVTGHIGDDIFVSGKSISILSGDYCIIISSGNPDAAAADTILKNAAEMAVGNLKRIQGK